MWLMKLLKGGDDDGGDDGCCGYDDYDYDDCSSEQRLCWPKYTSLTVPELMVASLAAKAQA